MDWKEICRIFQSVPRHKRAAALADAFRDWTELQVYVLPEYGAFNDVCELIADALEAFEPEDREEPTRQGWTIIDNVARRDQ